MYLGTKLEVMSGVMHVGANKNEGHSRVQANICLARSDVVDDGSSANAKEVALQLGE